MSNIIITVADIKPPAPGKKQASLIDSTGKRWGISVNEMTNYRQFGSYEVVKFKESYFQGKTYYTIEQAVGTSDGAGAIRQPTGVPLTGSSGSAPAPYTEDQRRMDIFVSVLINNSNIDPAGAAEEDLVSMVLKFKRVWKRVFGPQPDPISSGGGHDETNGELNDRIPF